MLDYDKAIEKVAGAVTKGFGFVDDFFFTKEEQANDNTKRGENYNKFMELTSVQAQLIRSKTRAKLVMWVMIPYIIAWIAKLPMMVVSIWITELRPVLTMWDMWLKIYTPIAGAFGGGYIGYYGVQMVARSFKQNNDKKK